MYVNHIILTTDYISAYSYCLKYETDLSTNRPDAASSSTQQVEVNFTNHTLLYELDESKGSGEEKTVCQDILSTSPREELLPTSVKIRQSEGTDGWAVKTIQLQEYPGSGKYVGYALDPSESRFWTDLNSDGCAGTPVRCTADGFQCCCNGEWCELTPLGNYYF